MADYTQPEYVDRRLRYFDGQFLREQDFIDEQHYHLDRERRLARIAHTAGVVEGLAVTAVPNAPKVTVAAGTALDAHGRLLVRVDDAEPVDLTPLVNRDAPVAVVLALRYLEVEADAPQGGGSPRWREVPDVASFLEGDPAAPAEDVAPRLARVTLHPDGTAEVDRAWAAGRSGISVGGALTVSGPASFPGGIDGGPDADGAGAPIVARGDLQVTRDAGYDGTVRLDVTNGATDFGRANVVLTGRLQDGNDGWIFGSGARTSVVLATNTATHGEGVGAIGAEQVSLQLEGNARALGILTRDRDAEPAVVVGQDGAVSVGTDRLAGSLTVTGDLAVRAGAAFGEVGRWTADLQSGVLVVTIAEGSLHNLVTVRMANGVVGPVGVRVPYETWGQWTATYTAYDNASGQVGVPRGMQQQSPGGTYALFGNASNSDLPPGSQPYILLLEIHHVHVVTP